MPSEVKQRKKSQKQGEEVSESSNCRDEAQKTKAESGEKQQKAPPGLDWKAVMCSMSLLLCGALSWMMLQHNQKFSQMEEKLRSLQGETSQLSHMEEEVARVSEKAESVWLLLEAAAARRRPLEAGVGDVVEDVARLKEWASGLKEKRDTLQISLTTLGDAVGKIEEKTAAITKDFTNKVASVRTDVRRMDGLGSELEALLTRVGELEDQATRAERTMVKRIGDVLTSSIERVSNLRAASERNTNAIQQLRGRVPELAAADQQIWDQLREMEGGRARLIRTVTFASDLRPKVATIRRDFGAFEPRLDDLTLRIGRLAEDLAIREREVGELRRTVDQLTAIDGDDAPTQQVSEVEDLLDVEEKEGDA